MSEGWALYAEQLADEAELWDSPGQRLLSLARRAEAVARLALGVGLHARGIAPSEGAALFSEWTGQDGSAAAAAVRRTLAHPGEGAAAEAGRRELVRLRRESGVGMERPGALREFHEAVLSRGGLAPGLVGWSMGLG
jgi:uncharacterized protein (DUF885 family)